MTEASATLLLLMMAMVPPTEKVEIVGNPKVVTADTIEVTGQRIRLAGVVAPDVKGRCDAERRLALVAKRELERIVAAGPVKLHRAPREDRQSSPVARVSVNGRDVGETLIGLDLARPWRGKQESWCR
jgi:endonuclease YncB( thermonuclease family)